MTSANQQLDAVNPGLRPRLFFATKRLLFPGIDVATRKRLQYLSGPQ